MGKVTWSPLQDRFLRIYYPIANTNDIGKSIGKQTPAVRSRAFNLGLKKRVIQKPPGRPVVSKEKPVPGHPLTLTDELSLSVKNLEGCTFLFGRKLFDVSTVSYSFGKYIIQTNSRVFIKDSDQVKDFLEEIKIKKTVNAIHNYN